VSGLVSSIAGNGFRVITREAKGQNHADLTVVDVKNEKPFSGTWWVDDIQLQFRCMFPDFSKVPLVVDVRGGRDGIDGKVDIEVVDNVWQIQKL
jgi:hypothetical protein